MAGKRRKRNKSKSPPQDLKLLAVRYKNEFLGQIKYYIDLWLGENTFGLLPKREIEELYKVRFTPIRTVPAYNTDISKKQIVILKKTLDKIFEMSTFKIAEGLPDINLNQFSTYYLTIQTYFRLLEDNFFSSAKELKNRYSKLAGMHKEIIEKATKMNEHIARMLGMMYSDPQICYYWISEDFKINLSEKQSNHILWTVNTAMPIVSNFTADKGKRPAFKLGIPLFRTGVVWKSVKPPDKGAFQWKEELEVFIQAHALKRLYERLDPINPIFIRYNLYYSFAFPEPVYENDVLLIPYQMDGITIGYFRADIVEGKILLRTFLFLTNEGTPEARKLKENTGLGKTDIKYLNIDKIKRFINSDIVENERIKNIFIEAGCGGLFNIKFDEPTNHNASQKVAEQMSRYLGSGY